jgi:hypothetical protein
MRRSLAAFATLAGLCLSGCGSGTSEAYEEEFAAYGEAEAGSSEDASESYEFDEDTARADAESEVQSEGYDGPCTSDCSGHDAGFAWAADGHDDFGISRSPSFDEGQEAYEDSVEERLAEKRQEFEDDPSSSEYQY